MLQQGASNAGAAALGAAFSWFEAASLERPQPGTPGSSVCCEYKQSKSGDYTCRADLAPHESADCLLSGIDVCHSFVVVMIIPLNVACQMAVAVTDMPRWHASGRWQMLPVADGV